MTERGGDRAHVVCFRAGSRDDEDVAKNGERQLEDCLEVQSFGHQQ